MPPISTPAVVLHAFKYSESSKIVRLATRDYGVLSAIAKGAANPKSKFGARLQPLSEGDALVFLKPSRDLQTLAEFDVKNLRQELALDVRRYASASALAELVLRFAPTERNEEIYDRLITYLNSLAVVEDLYVETVSISTLWGIIAALGFEPSVEGCARDGRALPDGTTLFSIVDGGFLCEACARGATVSASTTKLRPDNRIALEHLLAGRCEEVGELSPLHAAAHRRLLVRFIERHVAEERDLKALTFWDTLPWTTT